MNNITRTILIAAVPVVATIVDSVTGEWVVNEELVNLYSTGKLWVLILYAFFFWLVFVDARKNKKEVDHQKLLDEKNREITAYEKEISSLRDVFDFSQEAINKLTKNFLVNKKLDLREWNFEAVATYICKGVYSALVEVAKTGKNFTVNIYIREIDSDRKEYITMIAHEGENRKDPPNIFGVRRLIKSGKSTHYSMKQFIDNNPKINVLPDKASIRRAFTKYKDSYNQYIGIPICCKGNNMISLLEIIAHDDSVIAEGRDEILQILNKYIICYQYFALFAHMIEKNMVTTIDVMEQNQEVLEGEGREE